MKSQLLLIFKNKSTKKRSLAKEHPCNEAVDVAIHANCRIHLEQDVVESNRPYLFDFPVMCNQNQTDCRFVTRSKHFANT